MTKLYATLLESFTASPDGSGPTDEVGENNLVRDAAATVARAELQAYSKPFHTLRKYCESEWMAQHPIMDVVAWMGHSPTVAAKHYVRPTAASLERITGKSASIAHQTGKETHT